LDSGVEVAKKEGETEPNRKPLAQHSADVNATATLSRRCRL